MKNLAESACLGLRAKTPCWNKRSKITKFWLSSSFFDLIGGKREAEVFVVEKSRCFLLFCHGSIPLKCIFKIFLCMRLDGTARLRQKTLPGIKFLVLTPPPHRLLMDCKGQVLGTILRVAYVKISIAFFSVK